MRKILIAAFLLLTAPALAQNVQQFGNVTRGHIPMWNSSGVQIDGGSSSDSPITSIGVTNNGGSGICVGSDRITAPGRNQLCLGAATSGPATISLQNYGTALPQALNFIINGVPSVPALYPTGIPSNHLLGAGPTNTFVDSGITATGGNIQGTLGFSGAISGVATLGAQATAGTPALLLPTTSGTLASGASSPLVLNSTTGNLTCPTCNATAVAGTNGQVLLGVTSTAPQFGTVSQDCTITNTGVITCTKTNNVSFATSATTDTTNASNISSGTLAAARGGAGTITGALKGNGAGLVTQAACADLSNGAASCSTDTTNASNISSGTVASARGGAGAITGALKGNGSGVVTQAACADLSNGAASCSTDTTSASNISSGTLNGARLPYSTAVLGVQTPANPSGTTNTTTGVMMGLGSTCQITPAFSGRVLFTISGVLVNNTNGDGVVVQVKTGQTAAPANGAGPAGTSRTGTWTFTTQAAPDMPNAVFSKSFIITGQTLATAVWEDFQLTAVTGGTALVANVDCSAMEF